MTDHEFAVALGEEIKFWRERRRLSREQLADHVGVSANTIGRWERADTSPNSDETWDLSKALGVNLSVMIGRIESAIAADQGEREPFDDQTGDGD